MKKIKIEDRSVCFVAPVGKQAAAVAAPLLTFGPKAAKLLLLFSEDTIDEENAIRDFLRKRLGETIAIEEQQVDQQNKSEDWDQLKSALAKISVNLRPVLLANGGQMESVIKPIRIFNSLPQSPEPLVVISRDENALWFDLQGTICDVSEDCLRRIGNISAGGDLTDILGLARLEPICDRQGTLVGLGKQGPDGKPWKPGVPLRLEESRGFLSCILDLDNRLSQEDARGGSKLCLQTSLNSGRQGLMEASVWYHQFILSKNSFKDLGIEPRRLRFTNIASEYSSTMFMDRIRRHGFVCSTNPAEDTPERLLANTYADFPRPQPFDKRDNSGSPRRLAVIVGTEPTTTLLAIWKFKPDQLYLYYDKDSALSTLFCTRILVSLQEEDWCKYAYPVGCRIGEPIAAPKSPFSWNFKPGDKIFKTFLFLSWWNKKDMILQQLLWTGELVDIDGKPLNDPSVSGSGRRIGPPLQVLFKVHAFGEAQGQARDWNTEQHQQARRQMLQILADYRNNPGENGLNIANLADEARKQSNPSLKNIVEQELNALLDRHPNFPRNPPDKNRGFIWESITGILLAPLVDELMLNSRIVGYLNRASGRDSEEFDVLFRKGDKYGLLSCKFIGRRLNESENWFNCREAQNNAKRYLGSSSFSAVIYPDVSMFSEMLCRNNFTKSRDIAGVYHQAEEKLIVIDALTFPWMQTDVRSGLMDKLMASASGKGA